MGIGGHIHVEVVTEKIAFPVGIPSPVAVWLGVMTFAVTGETAIFLTFTDSFFSLLCSSPDRSAVTGKDQMVWINLVFTDGKIQELLFIEAEDKIKRIYRF